MEATCPVKEVGNGQNEKMTTFHDLFFIFLTLSTFFFYFPPHSAIFEPQVIIDELCHGSPGDTIFTGLDGLLDSILDISSSHSLWKNPFGYFISVSLDHLGHCGAVKLGNGSKFGCSAE